MADNYVPSLATPTPSAPPGGGSGSPEGVRIGSPFDEDIDTDDLTLYKKTSGYGTKTGWEAVSGGGGSGVTDGDKGDITVSGSGATWEINDSVIAADQLADGGITLGKLQSIGADSVLGRTLAGSGSPTSLGALPWADTGDVTRAADATVTAIASGVVTNAKLANMATATVKGRTTAGTGAPEDLATTGTGSVALNTSPTFVTPTLGVASATSINGSTIPASKTLVVTTDTLAVLAATSSAQLAGLISDETGFSSGALAVFSKSPTIETPTIASFTNANHNHSDAAGGGTIAISATTGTLAVARGGTAQTTLPAAADALSVAEVDVASATSCDIGAAASQNVRITGTTTITGLGTVASGVRRFVRFGGALTLTYNATSLILPGALTITTTAGDSMLAESLGSGNWKILFYQKADGSPLQFHHYATAVNVKASPYFATGNGTTDDTTALLAAIAAAGDGGIVYFPPGTYKYTAVLYPLAQTWVGDGGDLSILKMAFTGAYGIDSYTTPKTASFYSLCFDGGGAGAYNGGGAPSTIGGLVLESVGRVNVVNCTFKNYSAEALMLRASHDTLNPRDAFVIVLNCYFTNCQTGIYVREAEYTRIVGNVIEDSSFGIYSIVPNANIVGNRLTDCYEALKIIGARAHNTVVGNIMNHSVLYALHIEDCATALNITGNNMLGQGIVYLKNSSGVIISQNSCELNEFRFEGGGRIVVKDNQFYHTPVTAFTHNYNSTTTRAWIEDNADEAGVGFGVPATQTLAAGGIIRVYGPKLKVAGSGGAVTCTATPSVDTTDIPDGTRIFIQGTSDSNTLTLQSESSLTGSKLKLGTATRTLLAGDVLLLEWDSTAGFWYEIGGPAGIGAEQEAYSAGTVYSLTATAALCDFGTTDPTITVGAAGVYMIYWGANVQYNAATFASNQSYTVKVRRTNNTAADIANATVTQTTRVITTITDNAGLIGGKPVKYTAAAGDILQIWGSLSATPAAGSVDVTDAWLVIVRIQ